MVSDGDKCERIMVKQVACVVSRHGKQRQSGSVAAAINWSLSSSVTSYQSPVTKEGPQAHPP